MRGLFDIISNYWIWILLGLFIIIFTYIGYYAEKKGYLGKKEKNNSDDKLVDIDELSKGEINEITVKENKEEDLSNSFDVMPEIQKQETEVSEEIPEELFAPFGDEPVKDTKEDVSEVVSDNYNQEFVDIDKIKENAKDINNNEDKKDIDELMKGEEQIDMSFDVEGSSDSVKTDNIFANSKNKNEKKKEEENIDEMWKF